MNPTGHPTRPELLAPAGSLPSLLAALRHGADAVYFGLQDGFNARARAANFALAELPATVARVHRAGARAYLTVNTLVFEPELPALERTLRAVAAAGVDALIVQDPAVCLLARAICPGIELHASTQMTVAEPAAVPFAAGLGCRRVVVPRELSVDEIRAFATAAGTDVELEVFVHGALCVSWSGQCLSSEAWGGRSANRGQCAQSCRMPYGLVVDGELRDLGDVRYLLSPKDLAGARALPELLAVPVTSFKVEGRQKGPLYVATAVGGYRRWLDALAAGGDRQAAERQLAQDLLAMSLSYTRGFADGFLGGSDHQTLVEGRFPKHRGVFVGRVAALRGNTVVVRPDPQGRPWTGALAVEPRPAGPTGERSTALPAAGDAAPLELRPGMGIVFDQGCPEDEHEPGGPLFAVARQGGELLLGFGQPGPDLSAVRPGDRVFATSDPLLQGAVAREQDPEPTGRNAVDLTVRGALGEVLAVVARSGPHRAEAKGKTMLQPARGAGLDVALLADKLGGFGGTPFRLGALDAGGLSPGLHVPASELKELRRELVAQLLPQLERGPVRTLDPRPALPRVRRALPAVPPRAAAAAAELVPLLRTDAQLDAAIAAGCPEVELDWGEFTGLGRAVARARAAGARVVVATARVGKPGEAALVDRVRRLEPDGVLVRHLGALMRLLSFRTAGDRAALHGDFSLNAANSLTAGHLLGLGLDTVTASFDLDEAQLLAMAAQLPAGRLGVIVHHRVPTFHTEHCVYAHLLGNGRDHRSCGRPCERHQVALRDHLGREHPVIVDVGCRNTVFHHASQQSAAWVGRLLQLGVRRFRVEFVRESAAEVGRVLAAWRELLAGRLDPDGLAVRTGATSQFGVAAGGQQLLAE
ncbi:MAG: U32 family peptidase [Planctomycetes bacterium]|nr:U32 family peptidase [Planctomycetota bacterium]